MSSRLERKKREQQQKQQAEKQRKQLITAGIIAGALVALAIVVWVSGVFNPAPTTIAQAPTGACTSVQSFASQGQDHIAPGQPHASYSSNPPTSGPHWDTPQVWGVYPNQQVQEQLVHNLEHGGIVVQYKNLSGEELQALTALVRRDSYHMLLAPYPGLPGDNKVALTAWTKLQYCSGVDENAIRAFTNAFRDKGPELVP